MNRKQELANSMFACFRCGHMESAEIDTNDNIKCGGCGEFNTILTFLEALDILNELWVSGVMNIRSPDDREDLIKRINEGSLE